MRGTSHQFASPLADTNETARHALRKLNERVENEARRIAHELHDEASQMLASVYLAIAEVARDVPAAREGLSAIPPLLDQVTEQLRQLSHELCPIILDDLGLAAGLEFLAQGVARRTGLLITVENSVTERLSAAIETAVYRIFQEALTNVTKHARARRVGIKLDHQDETIAGSIRDDGIGIDLCSLFALTGSRGLGLIGIRGRLADVKGTLAIECGQGEGTTLEFRVPVERQ